VITGIQIHSYGHSEDVWHPNMEYVCPTSMYVVTGGERIDMDLLKDAKAPTPRQLFRLSGGDQAVVSTPTQMPPPGSVAPPPGAGGAHLPASTVPLHTRRILLPGLTRRPLTVWSWCTAAHSPHPSPWCVRVHYEQTVRGRGVRPCIQMKLGFKPFAPGRTYVTTNTYY